MSKQTLLATGYFSWDAVERRSDRYGSIRLNDEKNASITVDKAMHKLKGKKGNLFAEVLEPIDSPHMGDLVRGLKPSTPELGEIVVLGTGSLFIEHHEVKDDIHDDIGLKPDDDRQNDWLNPKAFYRLHLSKINLFFEEE